MRHTADQFIVSITKYQEDSQQWPQIVIIIIASVSAFSCGLHFSWTSPSIPKLTSADSSIPMTFDEASYLIILQSIGMLIATPFISKLMDVIGRKKCLLLITVPQLASWIAIAFAKSATAIYAAKFVAGIGDSCFYIVAPTYIGETAEPKVRGPWGNFLSIFFCLGSLTINIIGTYFSIKATAFICLWVPVVFFLMFVFAPETPYYLLMKGKVEEARTVLMKLRWMKLVDDELDAIQEAVKRQTSEPSSFKDLVKIASNRRAVLVTVGLRVIQQFSGQSVFSIYSQPMFEQAGNAITKSTSSIIYSALSTVVLFIPTYLTKKYGRRELMITSASACAVVLILEAIFFFIKDYLCYNLETVNFLPLVGMFSFIIVCTIGVSAIPPIILSEMFSAAIKAKALCVTNMILAILQLSSTKVFQTLISSYGLFAPFSLFALNCILGVVFTYYIVPETKDKTLEEIQQELKKKRNQISPVEVSRC